LLQWILLLAVAYAAYRWLGGWPEAAGVVALYLVGSYWYRSSRAHSERVKGALIISAPLSDSEKAHMGAIAERNERMAQRPMGKL
jgi:hypothetical protein